METIILVIIAVSTLILIHECGHFYASRFLGVKVEEFGFGFPPRLFSRVRKGVRYSFNAFPFGGFVKIFGEHGEGSGDKTSFVSRPAWQRFIILAAGVFMNLVLAWILFSAGAAIGTPSAIEGPANGVPVSVIAVVPGSPADQAGLRLGDQIISISGGGITVPVATEDEVRNFIETQRGNEIVLSINRGTETQQITAVPRKEVPQGEGPLGIAMARLTVVKTPWYLTPVEGGKTLWRSVTAIVIGFSSLIRDLVSTGTTSVPVTGPVGIFFFAQDTRTLGASYFLQFIGILSVNLAIMNFLPIPALDGGRIFFLLIEKIKGRAITPKVENLIHAVGFVVLITLMVLVTYKDIGRLW